MSKLMRRVFIVMAIVIIALACAQNTEAATVKYAKSIKDIENAQYVILEAADYPGYVAAPDTRKGYENWMGLIKYKASTVDKLHGVWMVNNIEQGWMTDMFGGEYLTEVKAPTYTITNHGAYDPSSTASTTRYVTYTKEGFYWLPERFVNNPLYEHGSDMTQRYTIKNVGTKDGKVMFRFYNVKSKISFASGGRGRWWVRIVR